MKNNPDITNPPYDKHILPVIWHFFFIGAQFPHIFFFVNCVLPILTEWLPSGVHIDVDPLSKPNLR